MVDFFSFEVNYISKICVGVLSVEVSCIIKLQKEVICFKINLMKDFLFDEEFLIESDDGSSSIMSVIDEDLEG